MEYWFKDEERGQETTLALDGTKTIENWFTSGPAHGKTRKTEITKNGKLTVHRRTYDEKGNLIKESKPEGVINEFIYAPGDKNFIQIVKKGGKEIDKLEYKDGKLVKDIYPGGFDEFTYDSRGREEKRFINGKLHSINSYADDNSWLKIIVYNHDKEIPEREIYNEYNHKGKLLSEKISELSGSKYEAKRTYYYNKLGELAKKIDSEQGTTIYISDNIDSNVKQSAQSK
jgi:antitoxin component YwqK of YwqJK toxin-antitoxin module